MPPDYQQPKMKLVENLTKFANGTSIHGFVHMAKSSSSKAKRIAWFLVFTGVMIYAGTQIADEVKCECIHHSFPEIKRLIC